MITSTKSEQVKYITRLQQKARFRKEQGLFVCEGRRLVAEVPGALLQKVYVTERFLEEEAARETASDGQESGAPPASSGLSQNLLVPTHPLAQAPREIVSEAVMAHMSDVGQSQGILALVRQPAFDTDADIRAEREAGREPLLLFLENIQDPGNLGTILRTAEAAGVTAVIVSDDTADIFSPKVVRATMGSLFRVPHRRAENFTAELTRYRDAGMQIWATLPRADAILYDAVDLTRPTAFLIGNEGNGLTAGAIAQATGAVAIPMHGQIESLNAGIAAGILLYEAARQRRNAAPPA